MEETKSMLNSSPERVFRSPSAPRVSFTLDGQSIHAIEGESLLAALMAECGWTLRYTERENTPRGMFCGMGVCMDCLIHLEGKGLISACMESVHEGMKCRTPIPSEDSGYELD